MNSRDSQRNASLILITQQWGMRSTDCCCYRHDAAKRQTVGIKFTHSQKSGFSPRSGDSLHRFRSNFVGPTGTWVHLAVQNFTSIGPGAGNAAPKISKISTF